MYSYSQKPMPALIEQTQMRARGKLLGLPLGKTALGVTPLVTDLDLSSAENRVARLSVMFGGGAPVRAAALALQAEGTAITVDNLLARVVALGGGPIRKTTNHAKTVEMIKTLAQLCHQNRAIDDGAKWLAVDAFNARAF